MRILIACEYSGIVRDAFIAKGHDAKSCDLIPTESPGPHYQGNVYDILDDGWDLMVCHPPCQYISSSGMSWNKRRPERIPLMEEALVFVSDLWKSGIPKICLENPVGCINTRLDFMPKAQYVQPYQFGHDASKRTGLWLKNLPLLKPTKYIEPRLVPGITLIPNKRWSNQDDTGKLIDTVHSKKYRAKIRAKTYTGIANAMADQWGIF